MFCVEILASPVLGYSGFKQPGPGWEAGSSQSTPWRAFCQAVLTVHCNHLGTWAERGMEELSVTVKQLFSQEHNIMTLARNAACGVLRVNY